MPEYLMRRDPLDTAYLPIRDFATAINASSSTVRNLITAGKLFAVKDGRSTKIRETPRQHLESLPPFRPGTMKPGPGRGHRREPEEHPSV
jgi:hypothetical protein